MTVFDVPAVICVPSYFRRSLSVEDSCTMSPGMATTHAHVGCVDECVMGSSNGLDLDVDIKELLKVKKDVLINQFKERDGHVNKKMKMVETALSNEKKIVERLVGELEDMRTQMEKMKQSIAASADHSSSRSSATTVSSLNEPSIIVLAKEYTAGQKAHLGKMIRHEVFKKHKVTNKQSFESGDIQKQCHAKLGNMYKTQEMILAYKEAFMKIVNLELGQKRSQVNAVLLKKWKGK